MEELRLLIVEDDTEVIETYKRQIDAYNNTNGDNLKINPIFEKEKESGLEKLRDTNFVFDGAIIDLDLKKSGGDDKSGNEIIKEIKDNLRFPVFVISGTLQNLDPDLNKPSSFFKAVSRDDDFDFVKELLDIHNTGILKILNRKGILEKYINKIFWEHISNSVDLWINDDSRDSQQKENSLLRYTLLHIQEYLELKADSDFENYHPAEIYITPPIKDEIFTGDLVKNRESDQYYIVLTPSCDLAHEGRTNNILLAKVIKPSEGEINEEKTKIKEGTNKKDAENRLKNLITNKKSKYHFLPKYKDLPGGLVDFQSLYSIDKTEVKNFIRLASLNSSFIKDIIARFSYYYSRQGSPDFDINEIYNSLMEND
ncbi:MAG: response regulator [Moheibacter sp.]